MTEIAEKTEADPATEPAAAPSAHPWAARFPELGTGPISTDRFVSEEYFERERAEVFGKSWINVGTNHDFTGDNSFFVREIAVLGVSLLVVKDKLGAVQAYHNVCSHRGNKLIWEKNGTCPKMFACRFHGWGYDATNGALKAVPDGDQFYFSEDKSGLGLVPVRTETWHDFVFVNLDDAGEVGLTEYLGPVVEKFEGFPFDTLELFARYDVSEKANWKVALDAQNEIYHVPMLAPLHRFLSGGAFHSNEDGYTRIHDFKRLGLHSVYTSESDADFEDTATGRANTAAHPTMGELKLPLPAPFEFHVLFPNFVLAFFNNQMFTYNIWPEAVDQTVWEIRLHYPKAKNLAERVILEQAKCRFRDLLCEDQAGHEALQVGLKSRARDEFVLGEQEIQIRAFHHNLDNYINGVTNAQ